MSKNAEFAETKKWLDLTQLGFDLTSILHNSGQYHLFILRKLEGRIPDTGIEKQLESAGFRKFGFGYAAKMTKGNARFLAKLPGAQYINVSTFTPREEVHNDRNEIDTERPDESGAHGDVREEDIRDPGSRDSGSAGGRRSRGRAEASAKGRRGDHPEIDRISEPGGEKRGEGLPADRTSRGAGEAGSGEDLAGSDSDRIAELLPEEADSIEVKNPRHFKLDGLIERDAFVARTRFEENMSAIRVLKQIEQEDREASDAEKGILALYSGWGGLSSLFDVYSFRQSEWEKQGYGLLRELLTDEELDSARSSVNNAHFTGPAIARSMWHAIEKMGFSGGRVLEPGCGVGNFLGLCPDHLVDRSQFHGVEKDSISGRIAQIIYPDAEIRIEGFEASRFPDGAFDLVIGNVPFGNFKVHEGRYAQYGMPIHDQFIVKSLDLAKPGGVVALITSSYTLDKPNQAARMLMHQRGYFAGALRLPSEAFKAQAGTDTTTDILFFVRRQTPLRGLDDSPEWIHAHKDDPDMDGSLWPLHLNEWFRSNTTWVLGNLEVDRGIAGSPRIRCASNEAFEPLLEARVRSCFENWVAPEAITRQAKQDSAREISVEEDLPEGSFIEDGGVIYRVLSSKSEAVEAGLQGTQAETVAAFIRVRDSLNDLFKAELSGRSDMEEARNLLNVEYDAFYQKYGALNLRKHRKLLSGDPACGKVMALESFDAEKETATKADIFRHRVINPRPEITTAENIQHALLLSLDRHGFVNLDYIATLVHTSPAEVSEQLHAAGLAFPNPVHGGALEVAADYLSGDVRTKLDQARMAAELDDRYSRNVEQLELIQPKPLGPADIHVRLGAPWIAPEDVKAFVLSTMELMYGDQRRVTIERRDVDNSWVVDCKGLKHLSNATLTYGTARRSFYDLLERALNNQAVTVFDKVGEARILNVTETAAAQQKMDLIQQKFKSFLWEDADRSERLLDEYNRRYNSYVPPKYDGSHLTFPGMSATLQPRKTQRDAIWRALHGNTLFNHEVGTGKTLEQVSTLVEGKRIGKWNKPCWIVPNHMLEQAEREARQLYPTLKILAVTKKELSEEKRSLFMGRCANNDWDIVIFPHSLFPKISVPKDFEIRMLQEELLNYRVELEGQRSDGVKGRSVKQIESKVKTLEAKINRLQDAPKDDGINFGELGLDALCVDESHNFKNLAVEAPGTEVQAGINGSKRAWDLYVKSRWLYELRRETSGVYFASGTPVSNNVLEIYNQQRLLQPDILNQAGVASASAWASTFLAPRTAWEPAPSGDGWKLRTRYTLVNVPELMQMLRMTMDVVTTADAGIPKPGCERINVSLPMSANQKRLMKGLSRRVERMQKQDVDPSVDNILKIVSEGRRLSLDERLLIPHLPQNPEGKVVVCARNMVKEYHAHNAIKGTQLVFCDLGTPKPGRLSLYGSLKEELVRQGIPKKEIAFIHDASSDEAKAALFQQVRSGRVRVLIGSTAKMGEGTNVQERIVAIHDMDPPWRATDIEQRGGRGVRFGNINDSIRRYIYTTEDTFDVFMWHTLKHKAELFTQVLKGDASVREITLEVDPTFAETAAITSNNALIKQKLEVEAGIAKLEMSSRLHADQVYHARCKIRSLVRDRQAKEVGLKNLEAIKPCDEPAVWTLDLKRYGHSSAFKGDRQHLMDLIKKLIETQRLKSVEGITCGGIPVHLRRTPEGAEWALGSDRKFTFDQAGMLERYLRDYKIKEKNLISDMSGIDKQIQDARTVESTPWEHDEELVALRAQHREILAAIEEQSKQQKEDDGLEENEDWLSPENSSAADWALDDGEEPLLSA